MAKNRDESYEILELSDPADLEECVGVIRRSFRTVAEDFGITEENAPSNPAFLDGEGFREYLERDVVLFGLKDSAGLAGCVAVEAAPGEKDVFYLERLAVLPEKRHRGYGKALMDRAVAHAAEFGGEAVSIGIIDAHEVLKGWYADCGFAVTGRKVFDHLPFDVCFMRLNLR